MLIEVVLVVLSSLFLCYLFGQSISVAIYDIAIYHQLVNSLVNSFFALLVILVILVQYKM